MYWENRASARGPTFQGEWTKSGDKYTRSADGYYTLCRAQRRHAEGERPVRLALRGRGRADAARGGARGGGRRQDRRRWTHADARLRGPQVRAERRRGAGGALQAFVKDQLAPYKYPREIRFLAELPKTATGKIQRFKLRERAAG